MALEALKAYAKDQMIQAREFTATISAPMTNNGQYSGRKRTWMTFERINRLQGNLEAIYQKQASDSLRSEQARHRLIKGWTDKEPAETLLLVAVECISLLTGDNLLLEHFKK